MKVLFVLLAFAVAFSTAEKKAGVGTALGCRLCQRGVEFLRNEAPMVEDVKPALYKLCEKVPVPAVVIKCQTLVDQTIKQFLDTVNTDETPEQFCTRLQLCNAGNAIGPNLCKQLQDAYNNTEAVIDSLSEYCSLLQEEALVTKCTKFLADNKPKLVEGVRKALKTVARMLPFIGQERCPLGDAGQFAMDEAKDINMKLFFTALEMENKSGKETTPNPLLCRFCIQSFKYIYDTLFSDTYVNAVKKLMVDLCKQIDDPDQQLTCVRDVAMAVTKIVELLKGVFIPMDICKAIGGC